MAATFIESAGAATQDFAFYQITTGAVSIATDQPGVGWTGTHTIKIGSGAGPTNASVNGPNAMSDAGARVSFSFAYDTLPAASARICTIKQTGGTSIFSLSLHTDGTLLITPVGATTVVGTMVMAANTRYRISFAYTVTNTTTFRFDAYINGVLQGSATAGTMTNVTGVLVSPGINTAAGANRTYWYGDIYTDDVADYTDPGWIRVVAKRPNANGSVNGFTTQIGAGGSGYGSGHSSQVNEQPLSQINGWSMVSAGAQVTEEYNIEGKTVGDYDTTKAAIIGVTGWVFAKSLANETASIIVDDTLTNIVLTSTAALFTKLSATPTVYPAGSGADIGIRTATDLTTVSLYECGVLIACVDRRPLSSCGVG
jgi:hypothetical protein